MKECGLLLMCEPSILNNSLHIRMHLHHFIHAQNTTRMTPFHKLIEAFWTIAIFLVQYTITSYSCTVYLVIPVVGSLEYFYCFAIMYCAAVTMLIMVTFFYFMIYFR